MLASIQLGSGLAAFSLLCSLFAGLVLRFPPCRAFRAFDASCEWQVARFVVRVGRPAWGKVCAELRREAERSQDCHNGCDSPSTEVGTVQACMWEFRVARK